MARDAFLASLAERTPGGGWADDEPREGLEEEQRLALTSLVDPQSPNNPWYSHSVRFRNNLIVRLLLDLGLRRGELLALRVEDLDLRRERLSIVARPDDPRDPRARQPVLKTEERVLALPKVSAELLAAYVLEIRPLCGDARKHGYLFVSASAGKPLSVSSVEKLFRVVRNAAGLPSDFSCHVLRHDWNERFSELMDQNHVHPEEETKLRRYLQGWKSADTAGKYTKRHTKRKAHEALLRMQERFGPGGSSDAQ